MNSRNRILALITLAALLPAASCSHSKPQAAPLHHGVGVVEGIDKSTSTIQINHEDIKDFMPAMSMPYQVKKKQLLDKVQVGDKVDFTIKETPQGNVLSEISKKE